MARTYMQPLAGVIGSKIGPIRFQFVAAGSVPAAVLSNHGESASYQFDGRPVRFRFLVIPTKSGGWERGDVAEPYVDFGDGPDPAPEMLRKEVHDACLDAWSLYLENRGDLVKYARLIFVNNDILQVDEKIARFEKLLKAERGKRKNLLELEESLKKQVPAQPSLLADEEADILSAMVQENCWLSLRGGKEAELHPYNSPEVLRRVNDEAASRLVLLGYVQLHRYLADDRTVFKVAKRGRDVMGK